MFRLDREPIPFLHLPRVRLSPRFLNLALAAGMLTASACNLPSRPTADTMVAIGPQGLCAGDGDGGYYKDEDLRPTDNSLISSLELCFNRGANDAVRMRLCFTNNRGEYRIISQQMNDMLFTKARFLYNVPKDSTGGCHLYSPVIRVEVGEIDQILIGERKVNEPYDNTYTGRTYQTIRPTEARTITVKYLGVQTIDPDSVVPDPQTPDYFKR